MKIGNKAIKFGAYANAIAVLLLVSTVVGVAAATWIYSGMVHKSGVVYNLTLDVSPDAIEVGTVVTLSGVLTRNSIGLSGYTIYVDRTYSNGTIIETLGTPTTDGTGSYTMQWTCDVSATDYYFQARWDKDTYTP